MNLDAILASLGLSRSLTQDVTLIIVAVLASFIFGAFIGRTKLVSVLINIYAAFAIISVTPKTLIVDDSTRLLVFLALVVGLTLAGRKLFDVYLSGAGTGFLWRIFVMSFLEIGLLTSIVFSLLPSKTALTYISASSLDYLVSGNAQLIWMAAPLVFLLLMHRRLNR